MATEVTHVVASSLRASITSHDVHSVQNIQIPGPELKEKEDRVDSPTPIIKGLEKAFSLNAHPVPDDSLKEITNIERPAPLQCIGKQREKSEDPGDQNSSIMSPTVISPTTKAALISAVDKEDLDRKYEMFLLQRRRQEELKNKARLKEYLITDILSFSRLSIHFGLGQFPGEVAEESLEVFNKSGLDLSYKIHVLCNDEALNQLDEYVFSMRKTGCYDYNDKYCVLQSPGVKSTYKIALKVPNTKSTGCIAGQVHIFSDDCKGKVIIPILSQVILPNLCSERALTSSCKSEGVLHFLIKSFKRQDLKVVLKNKSEKLLQADFLVIKDNYMMEHFDISFNPSVVAYQAGGQSTLGLIVRAVSSQSPPPPPENTMRCLLVAKVKNCSAKFTFKCEFRFMTDDQGTSGSD